MARHRPIRCERRGRFRWGGFAWRSAVARLIFTHFCERCSATGTTTRPAARDPARHRALRRLRAARDRSGASRLRAAVPALDRRRRQAPLDFAAARHRHRRLRPGRLGVPGRHPVLEGVLLRRAARSRPASSSGWPTGWRFAAYEWSADGREAVARAASAGRRGAFAFGGGRSHTIPAVTDCRVCHESRPHAGARLQPAPALARPRSRRARMPSRAPASISPTWSRPGCSSGCRSRCSRPAADRRRDAGRAGGARLPARQLRALPQRRRARCGSSGSTCATCRARRSSRRSRPRSGRPIAEPAPGQTAGRGAADRARATRIGAASCSGWARATAALQMPPLGTELVDEHALELVRQWIAGHGRSITLQTKREERGNDTGRR